MDTIKSIYTPLMKENSMKHIDYKTFNSIQVFEYQTSWSIFSAKHKIIVEPYQAIANPATEARYNYLQCKVADSVSTLKTQKIVKIVKSATWLLFLLK